MTTTRTVRQHRHEPMAVPDVIPPKPEVPPVITPYLCSEDGTPLDASTFVLANYLNGVNPILLESPEGRRALTKYDPLMFALVYCPNSIKAPETGGSISFIDLRLELCRIASGWTHPNAPKTARVVVVAPRESGKSTWVYKLLPLWAAAHGWVTFCAAFADSATQASDHLLGLRAELESNRLIRQDFPELVRPMRRGGNVQADSRTEYYAANGFVMKARGMESSVLGMKVGDRRPDLIIADDVEPGESGYSPQQAMARLVTLQDTILPLHPAAPVVLTGTVNMADSIMDQLVQSLNATPEGWITSTGFKVRYFPALSTTDDGQQRSIWPQKWPVDFLESEQQSDPRGFAKNYQNLPINIDGIYWQAENFQYGNVDPCSFTLLSVDPAVTSKAQSDYSGVSVIGYSKSQDKFVVRFAAQLRIPSYVLRQKVLQLLDEFPEIGSVLIETNQGADLWTDPGGAFYNLPNVKVITVHQDESKTLRAERALLEYTKGRVYHEKRLPDLERQLLAFPNLAHDDLVDSLSSAINQIRAAVTHDRNKPKGILIAKAHYR